MLSFQSTGIRSAAALAVAVVGLVPAGCGKPPPAGPVTVPPPPCEVLPAPVIPTDTITVALFERVGPEFAPWGHNASEDRVFRGLYETLITIDCTGRVGEGLALTWKSEEGGSRWVFDLRDGARFSDGSPVRAGDVVTSWADALMLDTGIDSAKAVGDRSVAVYLREPSRDVPLFLSAPPFSVAGRVPGARWPLGSGDYRIAAGDDASEGGGATGDRKSVV